MSVRIYQYVAECILTVVYTLGVASSLHSWQVILCNLAEVLHESELVGVNLLRHLNLLDATLGRAEHGLFTNAIALLVFQIVHTLGPHCLKNFFLVQVLKISCRPPSLALDVFELGHLRCVTFDAFSTQAANLFDDKHFDFLAHNI